MTNKWFFKISCVAFLLEILFAGPSHCEIIFNDNFNYSDSFSNHGWSAGATSSIAEGSGPDGTNALKITFSGNSNRYHDWTAPSSTSELWVKFNFRFDCGAGSCVGGAKFLKFFGIRVDSNYANITTQVLYESSTFQKILYGNNGITRDAQTGILYTPGKDPRDGIWHTWEVHIKYNDDGQNNGIFEVWYDNEKILERFDINNRDDNNSKFLSHISLGGWNQYYGGIPYFIYYDNIIISKSRVTQSPPKDFNLTNKTN